MIGAIAGSAAILTVALTLNVVWTNEVHADMQRALDSALLSASRIKDKNYANPTPQVEPYLNAYVETGKIAARNFQLAARYDEERSHIAGDLVFEVKNAFPMSLFATDFMRRRVESQITLPKRRRLEIAFALDMSASMQTVMPDGRMRMAGLQEALDGLLDLIENEVGENRRQNTDSEVLISIAPYASSVNVGHLAQAIGTPFSPVYAKELGPNGRVYDPQRLPPYQPHGPEPIAFFGPGPKDFWDGILKYYDSASSVGSMPMNDHQRRYWPWVDIRTANGKDFTERMKQVGHFWRGAWALERTGSGRGTDAAPEGGARISYADTVQYASLLSWPSRSKTLRLHASTVSPVLPVLPLTDDLTQVRAYTKHFLPYGGTAGHLGMEWAWYTLSPNWAGVWAAQPTDANGVFRRVDSAMSYSQIKPVLDAIEMDPAITQDASVSQLMEALGGAKAPAGQEYAPSNRLPRHYGSTDVQKIIIMMTDGQFSSPSDTEALGGSTSATYAHFQRVCEGARKAGVIIYTIALSQDARDHTALQQCAGQTANFFPVYDTSQLHASFRRIFVNTTAMYVSR